MSKLYSFYEKKAAEGSKDVMTKFKSQALHIIRIKY